LLTGAGGGSSCPYTLSYSGHVRHLRLPPDTFGLKRRPQQGYPSLVLFRAPRSGFSRAPANSRNWRGPTPRVPWGSTAPGSLPARPRAARPASRWTVPSSASVASSSSVRRRPRWRTKRGRREPGARSEAAADATAPGGRGRGGDRGGRKKSQAWRAPWVGARLQPTKPVNHVIRRALTHEWPFASR
jgi:hypothetical protein